MERRVHARLDRQSILTQPDPPQLIAVVDEHALRHTAEHMRGLMFEQLTHLIACAQRPPVSVHVVPAEVGLHVGMSGPFTLARSADGGWVGNLENQLAGVVVDGDGDVATLLSRWETVRNEAFSSRHSIDLMKEAVDSCT